MSERDQECWVCLQGGREYERFSLSLSFTLSLFLKLFFLFLTKSFSLFLSLEGWIDAHEQGLPELKSFILPGGTHSASILHLARSTCRRAERRVITLAKEQELHTDDIIVYLNRLSDYLFVLSRKVNFQGGVADVLWERPS